MIAFEILKNGKPLYTVGAGDVGHLQATARWMRMNVDNLGSHEHAVFAAVSIQGNEGPVSMWPTAKLTVGDEITLRMIETDSYDPPERTMPSPISSDGDVVNIYTRKPAD
jgi:hypothetical protein